jgi:CRP/FNR family transcriptional regulator
MTTDLAAVWQRWFPELVASADPVITGLIGGGHAVTLLGGRVVFQVGSACHQYLLVTQGSMRVQLLADNGREVVLYRVNPGQSCVLTTTCLLGGERYPAEGITEDEVRVLTISAGNFGEALRQSDVFRRFVFANLGRRFADVIGRMQDIAFVTIDRRLATVLLSRAARDGKVSFTHQELAVELGTAREVVSRHLKHYEANGWVALRRGWLELLDLHALRHLATTDPP